MVDQWNEYYSNNKPPIITKADYDEIQKQYNEMMSGTKKMTREEALRKLYKVNENNILNNAFLDKLEALGLIEFTVNEITTPAAIINEKLTEIRYVYNNQLSLNIDGDKIINYLVNHGWKIVKV